MDDLICYIVTILSSLSFDMERKLLEFSAKYGGLGIINPSKISHRKYRSSQILTQEGSKLIKNQNLIYNADQSKLKEITNCIKYEKSK